MTNRSVTTHELQSQRGSHLIRRYVPGTVALAVCVALYAPHGARAQTAPAAAPLALEEIVVTATRREENIQSVPVTITAFTKEQMDVQGVRAVDDIARLTPGVQFSRAGFGSELGNTISIRGVSSLVGPATTGIYVDDTPIAVNSTIASGNFADNAYPQLFDVERVEVLKGPQGTLFGSGSEGGTVRFITPSPNLSTPSVYVRSEYGYTENGGPSYEGGVAGGAPIIQDVLGFRASVWHRRDGGYVDTLNYYTGQTTESNANWKETTSARFALGWKPMDNLTVTPSVFFQHIHANGSPTFYLHSDGVTSPNPFGPGNLPTFVNNYGDAANGNYVNLKPSAQFGDQHLTLPALKVDWQLPNAEIISNTSYYNRSQSNQIDFSSLEVGNWAGQVLPQDATSVTPGIEAQSQHYFTQELRVQSTDPDARVRYVAGLFYTREQNNSNNHVYDPEMGLLISQGPLSFACGNPVVVANCVTGLLGQPLLDGVYSFWGNTRLESTQKAAFGQVDVKIIDHLFATVGLRYSKLSDDFSNLEGGPVTGVPGRVLESGSSTANATTPKYMLSYKADDFLVYGSATKGFRDGGVNPPLNNAACANDLKALGLTSAPLTYKPDDVWSYELGTKFKTAGGRLQIDASVFQIDWDNQIRNVNLTQCTLSFTSNLGKAQSRGADLAVNWRALDPLLLSLNAGYQYVKSTETLPVVGSSPQKYYTINGQPLPGSQPTGTLSGTYSFNMFQNASYLHVDYTFTGRDAGGTTVPNDPRIVGAYTTANQYFFAPGYGETNARLGMNLDKWDVSLFANNVFNAQPYFNETRGVVTFVGLPSAALTATTIRPRTFGVTAVYRY